MTRQHYQFAPTRTGCPFGLGLLGAILLLSLVRAEGASLQVSNTSNSGSGSLRQAILDANDMVGADVITFNIPGAGPHVISPTVALPPITGPATLAGYTQPGATTNSAAPGNNAVLKIILDGSAVVGAADGLLLLSSNCVVSGLIVRNHGGSGIVVSNAMNCSLLGNFIGTDGLNGPVVGNGGNGIGLENAANCAVGGSTLGDRNLIAGADAAGIRIVNSATNRIAGNEIYNNTGPGVILSGTNAVNNLAENNRITGNASGVVLRPEAGVQNTIRANSIYSNIGLGIDLNADGVTTNDVNDVDGGPNRRQNFPELKFIKAAGQLSEVRGTLFSTPSTFYRIDVFSSPQPDPSGQGEGQTFLGIATTTTDNTGKGEFINFFLLQAGQWITVTATSSAGDTSEFSKAEVVGTEPVIAVEPRDQTVTAGDTASFSVEVGGLPPFSFQWRRDGVIIPGETNQVLVLPDVQAGACYSVRVTNNYGQVISGAGCLTVQPRTIFTQTPNTLFTVQGGGGIFCSEVNAESGVTYQWRLNGVNLIGANQNCLNLFQISLANQGVYDVVVIKDSRILISPPASLVIQEIPRPEAQDNFADRLVIEGSEGSIGGKNIDATREDGEPDHAGKRGNTSVWYSWIAPTNGIALFDTVGSGFDTLLGVYLGSDVAQLTPVAGDEDRGGFLNSSARFNVQANVKYQIAVDGFAGASGDFVLSWQLQATNRSLPEITVQPASQVGPPGSNYTFTVEATGGIFTYHWFFRGQPIGTSQPSLTVSNAQLQNTGPYIVRIDGPGGSIESDVAFLELDATYNVLSADKPEDLSVSEPDGGSGGGPMINTFVPVTSGSVGTHLLSNFGAGRSPTEPIHCGVLGGASRWFGFVAETNGILLVSTEGSDFDTVIAVYSGPSTNFDILNAMTVDCDNDSGNGNTSRLGFPAIKGTYYYVAVDGAGPVTGGIALTWEMFDVPPLTETSQRQLIKQGTDVVMGTTSSAIGTIYQWTMAGTNLPGATNASLSLTRIRIEQGGDYRQLRTMLTAPSAGPPVQIAVGDITFTRSSGGGGTTLEFFGAASHAVSFEESLSMTSAWTAVMPTIAPATSVMHSAFISQGATNSRFFRLYLP